MVIKVAPGRFPKGGFIAAVIINGEVLADAWGRTKSEARKAAKVAAEEMGLWVDGIGAVRS